MQSQVSLRKHHYKASGGDGIPVELFQILKRWCCERCCCYMPANLENSSVATGHFSVFIPIPKKGNTKECSNYHTVAFISHASKVILKILQGFWSFNSMWTENFQIFKLDLERQRSQISNCQHPLDHWKSKRIIEKYLFLLYWLCQSLWLCESQQTVENT